MFYYFNDISTFPELFFVDAIEGAGGMVEFNPSAVTLKGNGANRCCELFPSVPFTFSIACLPDILFVDELPSPDCDFDASALGFIDVAMIIVF